LAAISLLATPALAQSPASPCGLAWCDVTDVIIETTAARTLTAADMRNSMIINNYAGGPMEFQLPPVEPGLRACFQNFKTGGGDPDNTMTLRPDASDRFLLSSGFEEGVGDAITSHDAQGASACMVGANSTHWAVYWISSNGAWVRE
jgi:hypothetical protein